MKTKNNIAIAFIFIWIGFVGAISFMEAWLKFQAPGITIPLGLGIGRLVFNALNKVELLCMIIIMLSLYPFQSFSLKKYAFISFPTIILLLQTFWILPFLDVRAEMYINGIEPDKSNMHFYYILSEIIKVSMLIFFGIHLLKTKQYETSK